MYCKNCGNDITGMKYCSKCGTAVEDNSENIATEPYSTVQTVKTDKSIKVMGYVLALYPLLNLLHYFIPSDMTEYLTIGLMGVFFGLWWADKMLLKKNGYTGTWTWWGFVFSPVYLFLRAKKVNKKYSTFIIFISSLFLVVALSFIPIKSTPQNYQTANDVMQQIEENKKKNTYSADYKWWENYGKSYTSTLDSGTEYLTHEIQFECNEKGTRNVILYADENRDGSTHLEFYSVVNGENYLLLTVDSFNTEYSTDFDVHSWTYKWTNQKDDEITVTFIAEENSLDVTSGYELFGIYGSGETPYNQMRSGTYYPIK